MSHRSVVSFINDDPVLDKYADFCARQKKTRLPPRYCSPSKREPHKSKLIISLIIPGSYPKITKMNVFAIVKRFLSFQVHIRIIFLGERPHVTDTK